MEFISEIKFSHIHIFSYSSREGTKAAGLPDQVIHDVKKMRSVELHRLAADMKRTYLQKHINKTFPILWEGSSKTEKTGSIRYFGYTPNFVRAQIDIDSSEVLTNTIQRARITCVNPNGENLLSKLLC